MRVFIVVMAIAACDAPTPAQPDAAVDGRPPLVLPTIPMNIVVTQSSISVYMDAADFGGFNACVVTPFATVGQCSGAVDGNPCWALKPALSCITDVGVELDGQRLQPQHPGGTDPWTFYYEPFGTGALSLVIAGCGHPETRIALDGPPRLQVEVSAVLENRDVHVAWTTDGPTTSAMAKAGPAFCHVEGVNEYTFKNWPDMYAGVTAFNSRSDVVSDFGPATIWSGTAAYTMVQGFPQ